MWPVMLFLSSTPPAGIPHTYIPAAQRQWYAADCGYGFASRSPRYQREQWLAVTRAHVRIGGYLVACAAEVCVDKQADVFYLAGRR